MREKNSRNVERPVRVLLLEIPQLLRGILKHAMQAQGAFVVMKDTGRALDFCAWPDVAPDVVILGLTDADDTTLLPALFGRWPLAQVMTLTPAGDDAAIYHLRLGRKALGVVTPEGIAHAVRDAVHCQCAPLSIRDQ